MNKNGSATRRRRDLINTIHLAVALAILISVVYGSYALLGLPAWIAVMIGTPVAYLVSNNVSRHLLPSSPPLTDKERLRMTPIRRWLILDVFCIGLLHFGGGISWALNFGITATITLVFGIVEWRNHNLARLRLERAEHGDMP